VSLRRPSSPRIPPVQRILDVMSERRDMSQPGAYNIGATVGTNRAVGKALSAYARVLMDEGSLDPRLREIVILRIGWDAQSVYEFGQHTLFGGRAGLSDEEIYGLTRPISQGDWGPVERALIQMTDDIYADDCVSDATWSDLKAHLSDADIIEAMAVVMNWRTASTLLNSCGVELDAGVPGWPTAPSRA
jgi:4-carboxymuconolactone decarboxylase